MNEGKTPSFIPARADRNAFLFQWAEKMSALEAIKEEKEFIESLMNALIDVLEMDVAICLELVTPKNPDEHPNVVYQITHLIDANGRLREKYENIVQGMRIERFYTPPYFSEIWDVVMNSINIPTPGFGPDFYLPLRTKTITNLGTFASPLILLDDTTEEVKLDSVSGIIRSEIMKVRPLYDQVSSQTGGVI